VRWGGMAASQPTAIISADPAGLHVGRHSYAIEGKIRFTRGEKRPDLTQCCAA
jgi:hypothetical protein